MGRLNRAYVVSDAVSSGAIPSPVAHRDSISGTAIFSAAVVAICATTSSPATRGGIRCTFRLATTSTGGTDFSRATSVSATTAASTCPRTFSAFAATRTAAAASGLSW